MKSFLFTQLRDSKKLLYLSILVSFSIIAYYHVSIGYCFCGDGHTYSDWADDLIKLNFNLSNYYDQNIWALSFFYTLPVTVVALLKVFFGDGWQYAFFVLNLSLVLFSLVIVSKSLLIIGVRPVLISITMFILVASPDLLLWPRYILSDTIFSFLVVLSMYIVIRGFVMDKINYIGLISIIGIILLSRPSSVPVVFAIFSFLMISRIHIHDKPKLILFLFIALFIITPIIFSFLHNFVETFLSDHDQRKWTVGQANLGMIIHDRPETWVSPPESFFDFTYLYFMRMISFFTPYVAAFSTIHIVLNSLEAFIIILSTTIWAFLGGNIKAFDKTVLFILLLSFSIAAYHSFTVIDYDFRYRFPLIMPLIMIFPIAMEILFKKYE